MKKSILAFGLLLMTSFVFATENVVNVSTKNTVERKKVSINTSTQNIVPVTYGDCTVKVTGSLGYMENKLTVECTATESDCTKAVAAARSCLKAMMVSLKKDLSSIF